MAKKPRIAFFGTPDFARHSLRALVESAAFDIPLVITQTDKPAGRGKKLQAPAVKQYAEAVGIEVQQPKSLSSLTLGSNGLLSGEKSAGVFAERFNRLAPFDALVVVAYGKMMPSALLGAAAHGCVNVHPSLLPRWRGPAPIQRTLFEGDRETGVCLMQLDEGLDSGPVYVCETLSITDDDTCGILHDRLAERGAALLISNLPRIVSGELLPQAQAASGETYAAKWEREDMTIRWDEPVEISLRRIRTCAPQPGARCSYQGKLVKIYRARGVGTSGYGTAEPGVILTSNRVELVVSCAGGQNISIEELQLEGKKRLPVAEVLRGAAFHEGEKFE